MQSAHNYWGRHKQTPSSKIWEEGEKKKDKQGCRMLSKMAKPVLIPIPLNGGKLGEKPALASAWPPCLLDSLQRGCGVVARNARVGNLRTTTHCMAWHGSAYAGDLEVAFKDLPSPHMHGNLLPE